MNTKTATARHPSRQAIAASALAIAAAAALALPLAAQADASPAAESAVMSFDITFPVTPVPRRSRTSRSSSGSRPR